MYEMDAGEYNLDRFLAAQDSGDEYNAAVAELRRGRKVSHWMWYVFPQIAGLGQSTTSRFYAISGLREARAFLRHPVLGPRLITVTEIVLTKRDTTAESIFGTIDAQKLRSSMTLFARAASPHARETNPGETNPGETSASVFRTVLEAFFDGQQDRATIDRL